MPEPFDCQDGAGEIKYEPLNTYALPRTWSEAFLPPRRMTARDLADLVGDPTKDEG